MMNLKLRLVIYKISPGVILWLMKLRTARWSEVSQVVATPKWRMATVAPWLQVHATYHGDHFAPARDLEKLVETSWVPYNHHEPYKRTVGPSW